jgi:hypothetical protein
VLEDALAVRKPKPGRPSKYEPQFAEQAAKLCKLGATDRELADFFKIAESTLNLWKLQHAEFSEALKLGKDEADKRVEQSLYHRALGYSHPDVHISNFQGDVTLTPITKVYPPETTACIFWLKNRNPEAWRDRVEHTGKDGGPIETADVSETERARRIAFVLQQGLAKPTVQ